MLNEVRLLGNLGQDPEVRYTDSGTAVANFTLATNERWTGKDGEKKEKTEWHRIVVWGKQAEIAGQYLKKGRQVMVMGSIQTRDWTDKEGNKRYTTEIRCQRFLMIGGNGNGGDSDGPQQGGRQDETPRSTVGAGVSAGGGHDDPPYNDDDIPF